MNILKNIEKIKKRTLFYNLFLCKVYKIVFNLSVGNSNKNKRLKNLASEVAEARFV